MNTSTKCDDAVQRIHPSGLGRCDCGRRSFFDVAQTLFARFGFRATTVEDICRAAGRSQPAFFRQFSDKQDFCLQLVAAVMNGETLSWEAHLPRNLDPLNRLMSLLDLYERIVREHPFLHVLKEDADLLHSSIVANPLIHLKQPDGPLDSILRDGLEAGQFKPVDARGGIWMVFNIVEMVYILIPPMKPGHSALEYPHLANGAKRFILHALGVHLEDAYSQTGGGGVECHS